MKKKNNIALSKKDFSFVCPLSTDNMTVIEGGHFCDSCEKKVHDVSDFTQEAYAKLRETSANVCISFKTVATVSLMLSLSACAKPQEVVGKVVSKDAKVIRCHIPSSTDKNASSKVKNNPLKPYKPKVQNIEVKETFTTTAGLPAPINMK
jgi:hypothetical protein